MPFLFPVTMVDTETALNSQFQGGFFSSTVISIPSY